MSKFEVGDSVQLVVDYPDENTILTYGDIGVIVLIEPTGLLGIDWGEFVDGHTCNGHCDEGNGWYVKEYEVELESKAKIPRYEDALI